MSVDEASSRAEELAKLSQVYDVSVSWLTRPGAEADGLHGEKVRIAARELGKLKSDDLDRLLKILSELGHEEAAK